MKSPLTTVLLAILAASALFSFGLCLAYISDIGKHKKLQPTFIMANNNRALAQALANEAVEYAKTHPAMDAIVESAGLKPGKPAAAPAAAKPAATKPAAK